MAGRIHTSRQARNDAHTEATGRRQSLNPLDVDLGNGPQEQLYRIEADADRASSATEVGQATTNLTNEQFQQYIERELEQAAAFQREAEHQQLIRQSLTANPPAAPAQDPNSHGLPVNGNTNTTVATTTANNKIQSAENSTASSPSFIISTPTQDAAADFVSNFNAHMNSRPGQQQHEDFLSEFGQQAEENQQPGFIRTDHNPFRPPPSPSRHENASGSGHRWQPY